MSKTGTILSLEGIFINTKVQARRNKYCRKLLRARTVTFSCGFAGIMDEIVFEEDLEKFKGLRSVDVGPKNSWAEGTVQMAILMGLKKGNDSCTRKVR